MGGSSINQTSFLEIGLFDRDGPYNIDLFVISIPRQIAINGLSFSIDIYRYFGWSLNLHRNVISIGSRCDRPLFLSCFSSFFGRIIICVGFFVCGTTCKRPFVLFGSLFFLPSSQWIRTLKFAIRYTAAIWLTPCPWDRGVISAAIHKPIGIHNFKLFCNRWN